MNRKERLLLWGSNWWYVGAGLLGPLLAVFTERIGGSILDIAWASAIYGAVKGILTIAVGKISDRYWSKERLMVLGYALNALMTFAYILIQTPVELFLVQAGIGVATALATPTWQSLYGKYINKKRDGWEWGLADGEADIIIATATIVGGVIVSYFSFTALFLIMGMVQVIATIYQAQILRKR